MNPYLAVQAIRGLREEGVLDETLSDEKIERLFAKSIGKGLQKVMSKMGISTLASYHGAQIFEAVGLGQETIDRAFVGTASRISGAGLDVIAAESLRRHAIGFPRRDLVRLAQLPNPGEYAWRPGGERHGWSPQVVASLQAASRSNSRVAYDQYARFCNDDAKHQGSLRGLLEMRFAAEAEAEDAPFEGDGEAFAKALTAPGVPGQARLSREEIEARPNPHVEVEREQDGLPSHAIPIDEVEPAKEIVKRFRTGAMSLGALSKEAHETLALAMNRVGGLSNSGEGGEDPKRFSLDQYPDGSVKSKRSAIKQIASGRFGVTSHYLANADRLQIKIAQGAKPGEGGQLPGFKVDPYIAGIRHSTPGVGLISPPPHHDIYSIEDLAQLIYDLKRSNPVADVSVKLVAEVGVGTVAAGVAKAKADHILISGADGGTGASPLTSIKHAGLPWELGLAEAHQTLVLNGLRSRVSLETDGGFKTGRDVVIAACLGAEEFGFSTAPMITMGCIMMRKCHLNTCPVGVCTQDPDLRAKFNGTPEHVLNYLFLVAEEARGYMARMGVRTLEELVGRVELLRTRAAVDAWKAHGLDLSALLLPAKGPRADAKAYKCEGQDHGVEHHIDNRLIAEAMPALEHGEPVSIELPITNLHRTVGTMLSWEVSKRHGAAGLEPNLIDVRLRGSAGQSLGAWLARGVSLTVTGDANDYVGKGLSGGRIVVKPPASAGFKAEENILIGNVALYGGDLRRGVLPRRRGRALLRPQLRGMCGRGGCRGPRLRVHDRRPRGDPRAGRPQLRRRHVRRHRLRARPRRHPAAALQPGHGRAGEGGRPPRRRGTPAPHRRARPPHRLHRGRQGAAELGQEREALQEGHAHRLPESAGAAEAGDGGGESAGRAGVGARMSVPARDEETEREETETGTRGIASLAGSSLLLLSSSLRL